MLNRSDIEKVLRINGIAPTAPDEEIRSILLSARYNNDEVDSAIMVLRENTKTSQTRVEGAHKIFRSDEALKPSEISALLGIEVSVDELAVRESRRRDMSGFQSFFVTVVSIMIAAAGVFFAMYYYQVGLFHPVAGYMGL
jgi:hypothetical protein